MATPVTVLFDYSRLKQSSRNILSISRIYGGVFQWLSREHFTSNRSFSAIFSANRTAFIYVGLEKKKIVINLNESKTGYYVSGCKELLIGWFNYWGFGGSRQNAPQIPRPLKRTDPNVIVSLGNDKVSIWALRVSATRIQMRCRVATFQLQLEIGVKLLLQRASCIFFFSSETTESGFVVIVCRRKAKKESQINPKSWRYVEKKLLHGNFEQDY